MSSEVALFNEKLLRYVVDTKRGARRQMIFRFPNEYGASLIQGEYTYGGDQGLFELAVLKWFGNDWELDYTTSVTTDVLGYLTEVDVIATLHEILALPQNNAPVDQN